MKWLVFLFYMWHSTECVKNAFDFSFLHPSPFSPPLSPKKKQNSKKRKKNAFEGSKTGITETG